MTAQHAAIAECGVKWEMDPSPPGTARVLTQTLQPCRQVLIRTSLGVLLRMECQRGSQEQIPHRLTSVRDDKSFLNLFEPCVSVVNYSGRTRVESVDFFGLTLAMTELLTGYFVSKRCASTSRTNLSLR